jgi:hypothetical protein
MKSFSGIKKSVRTVLAYVLIKADISNAYTTNMYSKVGTLNVYPVLSYIRYSLATTHADLTQGYLAAENTFSVRATPLAAAFSRMMRQSGVEQSCNPFDW